MTTGLVLDDAGFEVLVDGVPVGARRPLGAPDVKLLLDVAGRYVDAVHAGSDDAVLVELGRELFDWIDGGRGRLSTCLEQVTAPLVFEVRAPQSPSTAGWAVLRAPWEVLADQTGFLAADGIRRFEVVRRLGTPTDATPLDEYRLGLMFMASAPHRQRELDFEAEESAILTAVGDTRADLVVEDTGDPEQLGLRWADLGGLPVLHLSCHGVNSWPTSPDGPRVPVLMMEDEVGDGLPVTAPDLIGRLSVMPRLMFVSACLTATPADAEGYLPPGEDHRSPGKPPDSDAGTIEVVPVAHSLSTSLVRAGVPAVVGWDGSVTDGAATLFARHLYERLGRRLDLATAVGDARRKLLACEQPRLRADWHLARIWLGPAGGGPVVAGTRKRQWTSALHGTKTFLDLKRRHVPVATAEMFVGRRREMRRALRALRGNEHAGVLLHGQGRLGKSSLAARLADRFGDRAVAVVFGDYTAMGILEAIAAAVEDNAAARSLIEAKRAEVRDQPEALRWLLVDLLSGPCSQPGSDGQRPLLLIIDDLEQVLEPQEEGPHRVSGRHAPVLAAVLRAFDPERGDSRLILTSRFVFTLDGLPDRLERVQLAPLTEVARRKLAVRQQAVPSERLRLTRTALAARAVAVSRGNPGLQDLVVLRLVYSPQVDLARAEQAVTDIESYLDRGDLPADTEIRAFVENLALDALIEQAGAAHIALLRALTLFELPMPAAVTDLLESRTLGSVRRLCGLGLADTFSDARDQRATAAAVNALAAGRLTPLTDAEQVELATAVVRPLLTAWGGTDEQPTWNAALDLQLTRLAVMAEDPTVVALCSGDAVRALLAGPAEQALALGQQALAVLDRCARSAPVWLLRNVADAAQISGDGDTAVALSEQAVQQVTAQGEAADPLTHARVTGEHAKLLITRGALEQAEQLLNQAREMFTTAGSEREAATAWGDLAEILFLRGGYDEALRIRHEIELPVYQRLGDTRAIAIAWGRIADIHYQRGEYDEALRIRQEVQLPVYQRLGDTRSTAIAWGAVADIRYQRGEYDEALRIRHEIELPVYQRLGDTRETAITWGKIADIRYQRRDFDEAFRIRHEIELPVYQRLGDTRAIAVTWGKIADIRYQRGESDDALRIRQEVQLPVYQRLGDTRAIALNWERIAEILFERGDYDEALRIRLEMVLPAAERLNDMEGIATTTWGISQIQVQRQDFPSALSNMLKAFEIFDRLRRPDGLAVVGANLGVLLTAYGKPDDARKVWEKSLAAATKVGLTPLAQQIGELLRGTGSAPHPEDG
ncbi:hypothetical protein GCM10010112_26770 [Actinoplanes lobatus]|uniref:Tetratricopeptide (TPR) repeat protein n=1 Tax=Actinoplanes lobatus TaxID=113568 RepID=A0A7W7HJI4_9ACTN|nr:tetratricopeptide repeat protein [Actinoplanes lobatus]MBB4751718.1 tetratricopeptide (TPR) repeat protein [Actinoplanes lobatus]GGN65415.1 hypothetical protein GCM10010112_26770 [Actinoplanes lobatus]GIE43301.1 hypothetical protein Alo02nite_61990 [Actinoplanes lobatus]